MGVVLKLCVLLTTILFGGVMAALGASSLAYHDPFAPYAAIMPGESADAAMKDHPCQWIGGMFNGAEQGFCQFQVVDSVFSQVTVIKSNYQILHLAFAVQPNRMRLGDLMLCWGKPNDFGLGIPESTGLIVDARWRNGVRANVVRAQYRGRQDHFLSVDYLVLEQEVSSCVSGE
jgi:hypothetical protein